MGLVRGTATSAIFHALTISGPTLPALKAAYIAEVSRFPSEMAQNFWLATFAFAVCFTVTVVLSLATQRDKSNDQLKGLVYSLTPHSTDDAGRPLYARPWVFGVVVLICAAVVLNYIFW